MSEVKDYPPYLDYPKERRLITNADKIRAMTNEELAAFLELDRDCYRCTLKCIGHDGKPLSRAACMLKVLDWLKQEA